MGGKMGLWLCRLTCTISNHGCHLHYIIYNKVLRHPLNLERLFEICLLIMGGKWLYKSSCHHFHFSIYLTGPL